VIYYLAFTKFIPKRQAKKEGICGFIKSHPLSI
jgi:hypothetical protein